MTSWPNCCSVWFGHASKTRTRVLQQTAPTRPRRMSPPVWGPLLSLSFDRRRSGPCQGLRCSGGRFCRSTGRFRRAVRRFRQSESRFRRTEGSRISVQREGIAAIPSRGGRRLPGGAPQEGECPHRKQSAGLVGCQLRFPAPEVQRSSEFRAMRGGRRSNHRVQAQHVWRRRSNKALQAPAAVHYRGARRLPAAGA